MRRLDHVKLAGTVDIDPGNVPVRMDGVELGEHRCSHRRIPQDLKGLSGGLGAPVVEIRAVFEDPVSRGVLAKVPACTPHGFRRTFATSLLEAGTDLHLVQSALGHEDIKSTTFYPEVTHGGPDGGDASVTVGVTRAATRRVSSVRPREIDTCEVRKCAGPKKSARGSL